MTTKLAKITYGKGQRYVFAPNDAITFFVSQTNIDFTEMEVGHLVGPPLHFHPDQDEIHYIIKGKLQYEIDQERIELEQGDYLVIPKGIVHAWINLQPEPARVIAILTPGGSEAFFKTISTTQLDAEAQMELAHKYGAKVVGPPLTAP